MMNADECRAKSAAAWIKGASASDESFRAHFELMALEWDKVAIMAEWQDSSEADRLRRPCLSPLEC